MPGDARSIAASKACCGGDDVEDYQRTLILLYGTEAVRQAEALLDRSERFFGLDTLGPDMQGSAMHQILLAAYDKLFAPSSM